MRELIMRARLMVQHRKKARKPYESIFMCFFLQ